MTKFSVFDTIREVLDESDVADPKMLAKLVLAEIPKSQTMEALEQVLPTVLTQFASRGRLSPPRHAQDYADSSDGPSRRVASIREGWRNVLHARMAVGNGQYKLLRDCTAIDLETMAKVNDTHAEQNAAAARRKRRIATRMTELDVKVVGELPDNELEALLCGDAT